MTALAWLLTIAAVYRLTLLVVADKITEPLRDRAIAHGHELIEVWRDTDLGPLLFGGRCSCLQWEATYTNGVEPGDDYDELVQEPHRLHVAALPETLGGWRYLLTCPWCASVWIAGPVVASGLAWSTGWGWQLAAGLLAASAVTGTWASRAAP